MLARCGLRAGCCLALLLAAGCSELSEVKAAFEWYESCPVNRVEAFLRTDLEDTDPSCRSTNRCKQPPPELRDDPGRLAVWRASIARQAARDRVYVVSGCGERRLYVPGAATWVPLEEAKR